MPLVLILDDLESYANTLLRKFHESDAAGRAFDGRFVRYQNANARVRDPQSVAAEAIELALEAEGPTAFVVDLCPRALETPPNTAYGFEVITHLAAGLTQAGGVHRLLRTGGFMPVVLTIYDGWKDDVPQGWQTGEEPIEVRRMNKDDRISAFLAERKNKRILPLFWKNTEEGRLARLLLEWDKQLKS